MNARGINPTIQIHHTNITTTGARLYMCSEDGCNHETIHPEFVNYLEKRVKEDESVYQKTSNSFTLNERPKYINLFEIEELQHMFE